MRRGHRYQGKRGKEEKNDGGAWITTRRFPRVLWRMARRDLRRHLRRSVLIATIVALPVAGLTAGILLLRAASPTDAQRAADMLGTASLRVDATSPQAHLDAAALPAGSRTVAFSRGAGLFRVGPGDIRRISLTDLPLGDPLTAGMLRLQAGRAPSGPGEVAVSTKVMRELGRRVGDTMQLVQPNGSDRTVRITGSVIVPTDLDTVLAVTSQGVLGPTASRSWLVVLPANAATAGDQRALSTALSGASGLNVTTREEASAPSSSRSVRTRTGILNPVPIIAGLALMIAALVAAAAFAAGVRREVHELGLLAAAGGSPAQLRRAVLARGATLGVAGGLAGLALGVLAAAAVHPWLGAIIGHLPRPIALPLLPLLGVVAAAVLAGTAAAWFPARFAARVPPVEALDAHVPSGPPPRHVSRLGVLAVALGCVITAVGVKPIDKLGVSLAGMALLRGGFVACSAAVVAAVEPLARHLPLAGRVATRQAARNRSRAGPAVAAIAVAMAVPVLVSSVMLTTRGDDRALWLPALGTDQLRISHLGDSGDHGGGDLNGIEFRDSGSEAPSAAIRAVLAALPGAVAGSLQPAFVPDSSAGSGQTPPGKPGGGPNTGPPVIATARALYRPQADKEPSFVYVGGDDLLAALGAQSAAADLAAGKVVGIGPGTVHGGQVALHHADFLNGKSGSVLDHQAQLVPAVQVGS